MLFQASSQFSDELLAQFAHEIVRNPHDRYGHAVRACDGDFAKVAELMQFADSSEFNALLMRIKKNMTELDKSYTKEQFMSAVQDKMNGFEGELWLKTAQFFAKLKGWTVENGPTIAIQNNVIAVPANQPMNAWEQSAVSHQQNLQAEARVINE